LSSSAEDLRDIIQANWQFDGTSGNLRLSKFSADPDANPAFLGVMNIPVKFFDRPQVEGNIHPKAIEVVKVTQEGDEGIVQHPQFNEITDTYYIKCRNFLTDVSKDKYSLSQSDMQEITDEVTRILDLTYLPSGTINSYFITRRNWENLDNLTGTKQKELIRLLRFSLTKITSDDEEVYRGFGGVLVFDTSDSQGDSKPVSDYTFVSVKDVNVREGFSQIPTLTKDTSPGVGVPLLMRGQFSGTFSALMYAQKTNIIGSTVEKLQNIYRLQTASPIRGQNAEIVLLRSNTNTENPISTLTRKSFMRINQLVENEPDEDLVSYNVIGTLSRPTIFTEST